MPLLLLLLVYVVVTGALVQGSILGRTTPSVVDIILKLPTNQPVYYHQSCSRRKVPHMYVPQVNLSKERQTLLIVSLSTHAMILLTTYILDVCTSPIKAYKRVRSRIVLTHRYIDSAGLSGFGWRVHTRPYRQRAVLYGLGRRTSLSILHTQSSTPYEVLGGRDCQVSVLPASGADE